LGGIFKAFTEIGSRWILHNHSRSAAALAFYSLFSLVPLLGISTRLAGILIGVDAARAEIAMASAFFLNDEVSAYLLELVVQQSAPGRTGWMSLIAFGVLLFTASIVVVELREVLSAIFGKRERVGKRAWAVGHLLNRGVPILLILSLGFVIAISSLLGALFHLIAERYDLDYSHLGFWRLIEQSLSFVVLTLIFTFVLRWLPSAPPSFRAALGGALVAGLLLGALRNLMGFYFQSSGIISAHGAAVTLVVLLLWIYFSVQIFFIGAEAAGYFQRRQATRVPLDPDSFSHRKPRRGLRNAPR